MLTGAPIVWLSTCLGSGWSFASLDLRPLQQTEESHLQELLGCTRVIQRNPGSTKSTGLIDS